MQGICIKDGASSNLVAGQQYYLFEHSKTHYYASKFDTLRSFFGLYRKSLFDVPVAVGAAETERESEPKQLSLF